MSHTPAYMPVRYRLRRPVWPLFVFITLTLVISGLVGIRLWRWPAHLGVVLGCAPLAIVPMACRAGIRAWRSDLAWECRIEADVLAFRTPWEPRLTRLQIGDIEQIVAVRGKKQAWFEVALRGWTRVVVVDAEVMEHRIWRELNGAVRICPRLRAALLAVNPAIHFSRRREC